MYKVVKSNKLSTKSQARFVIVDIDTGEVVNDANGWGYKTYANAQNACKWQVEPKKNEKVRKYKPHKNKYTLVHRWMKENDDFVSAMTEVNRTLGWGELSQCRIG